MTAAAHVAMAVVAAAAVVLADADPAGVVAVATAAMAVALTGPLTPEQRAMVEEYAARARPFMAEWRENRRIWRDALAAALADRRSGEPFAVRMTQLIARPDDLWTPQYRMAIDGSRAALIDLLVDLDATLTAKQRGAGRRELASLADEVQGLARVRG